MDNGVLDCYGYVLASSYRYKVLNTLSDGYKTPTKIANDCGIRTNHISKVLAELKKKDLVKCINENARKGRLYIITDTGKNVISCFGED